MGEAEESNFTRPNGPIVLKLKRNAGNPTAPSKELQIVGPTNTSSPSAASSSSSSPFQLPDGWVVKEQPRKDGRVDKYYYEPGTARQFRSLVSVKKYLAGDINAGLKGTAEKHANEEQMQIVPRVFKSSKDFNLPDGWVVEEKPRQNPKYAGVVDRYYIDPETGMRFRSLQSVEKCLKQREEDRDIPMVLTHSASKSSSSQREHASGKEAETNPVLDFSLPPAKVKWVLGGIGGSIWRPFINDSLVPESIKHNWSEKFVSTMNNRKLLAAYENGVRGVGELVFVYGEASSSSTWPAPLSDR